MKKFSIIFVIILSTLSPLNAMQGQRWQKLSHATSWVKLRIKDVFIKPTTPRISGKTLNEALLEHEAVLYRTVFGHSIPRCLLGYLCLFGSKAFGNKYEKCDSLVAFGVLAGIIFSLKQCYNMIRLKAFLGQLDENYKYLNTYRGMINPKSNPRLYYTKKRVPAPEQYAHLTQGVKDQFMLHTLRGEWDGIETNIQGFSYLEHPTIKIKGCTVIRYKNHNQRIESQQRQETLKTH